MFTLQKLFWMFWPRAGSSPRVKTARQKICLGSEVGEGEPESLLRSPLREPGEVGRMEKRQSLGHPIPTLLHWSLL